jgi:hypothetical protein
LQDKLPLTKHNTALEETSQQPLRHGQPTLRNQYFKMLVTG